MPGNRNKGNVLLIFGYPFLPILYLYRLRRHLMRMSGKLAAGLSQSGITESFLKSRSTGGTEFAFVDSGVFCWVKFRGEGNGLMVIDNRHLTQELQSSTRLSFDAYEAYWSSTEDNGSIQMLPCSCRPGDAYSELWQLWDAR